MAWHREPMKDAASGDNPLRGAHILRPGGLRMGEPMHSSVPVSYTHLVEVKEMKFRPKIDVGDYETKKGHVLRFLKKGARGT